MSYTYRYMEKQTLLELIDKGLTVQKIADHEERDKDLEFID